MTVRITRTEKHDGRRTVVRIEGKLTRDAAELLDQFCEGMTAGLSEVAVDLAGVHFVDAEAAAVLRRLSRRGALLEGTNPYVRQLVDLAE